LTGEQRSKYVRTEHGDRATRAGTGGIAMSSWFGAMLAASRAAARIGALAGLIGGGLLFGPTDGRAAEHGAPQAGAPAKRVSPYSRYARDRAKSVEKQPARMKPFPGSAGHRQRVGARGRH
jgi:hypothetical protein